MLVAGILLVSYPGLATGFQGPSQSHHQVSHDEEVADEMLLHWGPTGPGPAYLVADVAVDEEFAVRIGDGLEAGVYRMLAGANELLGQVGLNLRVGSIQRWRSDDGAEAMAGLLDSAEAQALRLPGRAMLAITGQRSGRYDGWNRRASTIVRYYEIDRGRNSTLIAHEVAHLLGARHHEDGDAHEEADEPAHEDGDAHDDEGEDGDGGKE